MTEKWAWEFRLRCKFNVHNSTGCFDPSPLTECAAGINLGQVRYSWGGGRDEQRASQKIPVSLIHSHIPKWGLVLLSSTTSALRHPTQFSKPEPQLLSLISPSPSCLPPNMWISLWLFHVSPSLAPTSRHLSGYGLSSTSLMLDFLLPCSCQPWNLIIPHLLFKQSWRSWGMIFEKKTEFTHLAMQSTSFPV